MTGLSEITYNGLKSFLMEHSWTCVFMRYFFHFHVFVLIMYKQFFKISFENCKHVPKPKYYFNQKVSYPVLLEDDWSFSAHFGCKKKTHFMLVKGSFETKRHFQKIKKIVHISATHFLYRFLDGKKTTRSQFSIPGLGEIHRNLKKKKKINSRKSFFRKSPFCTFSCINPGFGRPWDKLWIFFSYCHFYNTSKGCFWPKTFLNFMHRFKSAILAIFHFCILLEHYENGDKKNSQGLPNPGFMQEKVQKGDFLWCPMMKKKFNPFFRFYTSRVHDFC